MERLVCITEQLVRDLRTAAREEREDSARDFHPNVLIVEDDPNDAELSLHAVEAVEGVTATLAKTGDEAINLLNMAKAGGRPPFHIVFLDLNLIGSAAQGYQVLAHIRKIAPHLHVVIVSGYVDPGVLNFLATDRRSGGYLGVIMKPLHKANLKEILGKHRMSEFAPVDYEL